MKRLSVLMMAFILVAAVFAVGCEKKEAPKATEQPTVAPAPVQDAAPATPAPASPAKK